MNKGFFAFLLMMGLPFLIFALIGLFLIPHTINYLKEILSFLMLTIIFTGFSLVFTNQKVKTVLSFISILILSLLAFFKLYFYKIFGFKISSSSVFVFFETNFNESMEFVSGYTDAHTILLLIVFLIPIGIFIVTGKKRLQNVSKIYPLPKIAIVAIMILSLIGLRWKFADQSLLFTLYDSVVEYKETKQSFQNKLAKFHNDDQTVQALDSIPKTMVIIIGESTSKWHMQLYGYTRETNPKLSEIKDELLIFNNVETPEVQTIRAMNKITTLADNQNENPENNISMVQLANQANYETTWLSNQQPVGFTESVPTMIGNAALYKTFMATDSYFYTIHDGMLIPELEKVLKQKAERKMIFVHLIGTHRTYSKRFPKEYEVFSDNQNIKSVLQSDEAISEINAYDNAVLYNDYVVREMIETVRAQNDSAIVVYFSDHGDEVYDTMDFVGHHMGIASRPMFEIPFLIWFSGKYKGTNSNYKELQQHQNTAYNLENFIHTFADLSNINFDSFQPEKSLWYPKSEKE